MIFIDSKYRCPKDVILPAVGLDSNGNSVLLRMKISTLGIFTQFGGAPNIINIQYIIAFTGSYCLTASAASGTSQEGFVPDTPMPDPDPPVPNPTAP